MDKVRIFFDETGEFEIGNVKLLSGVLGLYFICLSETGIRYPFGSSRLIYIGMSEKRTNSIGKRLMDHYEGKSGNVGLVNYRKMEMLRFTYINFEMLRKVWDYRIEDLESYFILDFVKRYGVYPICNNKTGFEVLKNDVRVELDIDWGFFEKGMKHG